MKKKTSKELVDEEILPTNEPIRGIKDTQSDLTLLQLTNYDHFQSYISKKEGLNKVLGLDSGLKISLKSEDVEAELPEKLIRFCEEQHIEINSFVNTAIAFFTDIMINGRDRVEFKLATRIRNCPYIKMEHKTKALLWCFLRFRKQFNLAWKILKKQDKRR